MLYDFSSGGATRVWGYIDARDFGDVSSDGSMMVVMEEETCLDVCLD